MGDPIQNSLHRIGGVSALICAGMYFVALGIYIPSQVESTSRQPAGNVIRMIFGIWI